jgi:predicted acetyltransferase
MAVDMSVAKAVWMRYRGHGGASTLKMIGGMAHGVWDVIHIRRDQVVSRGYAGWCAVLDLLIAFGLVFAV